MAAWTNGYRFPGRRRLSPVGERVTPPADTPRSAPLRLCVASWLDSRRRRGASRLEPVYGAAEQAPANTAGPTEDTARGGVAFLACLGVGLLITSELVERLEHLEGEVGLGVLNLIFAVPIAAMVVSVAALIGDSLLGAGERRSGRRPGPCLATGVLGVAGAVTAAGIIVAHLRHAVALDAWIGLSGGLLLVIAAIAHHVRLSSQARPRAR